MRQAETVLVCLCLVIASYAHGADRAGTAPGTLEQARRLIEAKDYASAATLLEDLLPETPARERQPILAALKQSYEALVRQAEVAGNERDAAYYRDNLAILNPGRPSRDRTPDAQPPEKKSPEQPRSSAATKLPTARKPEKDRQRAEIKTQTSAPAREPAPAPKQPASPIVLEQPADRSDPPAPIEPKALAEPPIVAAPSPSAAVAAAPGSSSTRASVELSSDKLAPRMHTLDEANQLFSARKYKEAGESYAALARENRLPANRINHWAYCRMYAVAVRMNAHPQSEQEWSEIDAEIQSIQRLAPKLWYGEYLRNRLTEARKNQPKSRTPSKSDNIVVRGSAPDENDTEAVSRRIPRLFGKLRGDAPARNEAPTPAASDSKTEGSPLPAKLATERVPGHFAPSGRQKAAQDAEAAAAPGAAGTALTANEPTPTEPAAADPAPPARPWNGEWQVHETPNFLIFHADAGLAESAAQAAESVRLAQGKRWGSPAPQQSWPTRCEVYLYPDGKAFAKATGQPESSPGFSTLESDRKQITTRKIHLRADQARLLEAVLPHEVTHVVVADLFTAQQIPRWADEGIAVLAEPETEQTLRAADLRESLTSGHVFELQQLMSTDTPPAKDWSLYYAQSVSLTRFLVARGTPAQMIQFVRDSGTKGAEVALRNVYQIGSFAELEEQWRAYAKEQLAALK